jgi:NAD(P)-dependent dehydrogenase (short-subunit alcohol dehydrogenase family)
MSDAAKAKTAVVTGAGGGIGGAVCTALRAARYRVIGCDVRDATPDCDLFLRLQLRDLCGSDAARGAVLSSIRGALGSDPLTLLVNNAAVQLLGSSNDLSVDAWRETLDVNLLAPFLLTQGLLPELERARGSVVNVASVHASLTKPGFVAYATSKSALVGLTRSMAVDLGGRVRVNAVLPAATATPMLLAGLPDRAALDALGAMHPMGRIARPDEVAAAIVYLASDGASFVTGAAFAVDGGVGARLHDPV